MTQFQVGGHLICSRPGDEDASQHSFLCGIEPRLGYQDAPALPADRLLVIVATWTDFAVPLQSCLSTSTNEAKRAGNRSLRPERKQVPSGAGKATSMTSCFE